MSQDTITGTDSVKSAILTKINGDMAELFASIAAIAAGSGIIISANDSTPGALNGKLTAGSHISLTEGNDGGNETLEVQVDNLSGLAVAPADITGLTAAISAVNAAAAFIDSLSATYSQVDAAATLAAALTTTYIELNQLHSQGVVAADFAKLQAVVGAAIADLTSAQTLTNKTLTSPKLNEDVALTANSTDLNRVPGVVAGTQALSGLDVNGSADISGTLDIGSGTTRRAAPAGTFVNNANENPNISDTPIIISTVVTISTWESIGPTGSGADNEWGALDSVPLDADWIKLRINMQGIDGAASTSLDAYVHARQAGGDDEANGDDNRIAVMNDYSDGSGNSRERNITTHEVPVDATNIFDVSWASDFTTTTIQLYLIGWGFNP